jgi:membrane protease YdiL (CAAX protease family)
MNERINISDEERLGNPEATAPENSPASSEISSEASSQVSGAAPEFSVQPSYVRTVFVGPQGLRTGWGLAFYVAAYYVLQSVARELAWSRNLGADGLWSMMLEELGVLLAAVIPAIALGRVEKRPWEAFGLPGRQAFGKLFWVGGVWGFASITLLLGTMYGLRVFELGHLAIHGARIVRFGFFWAGFFLLVGLFEEFLLRGYSQFTLTRATGFWPAAVITSCLFSVIHINNEGEQWPGLMAVVVIGFFFCLTLWRTGTLWFGVGFHAAWDWGETFFYSVPDSGTVFPGHLLKSSLHGPRWLTGGIVGPEGSALCFVVLAVTAVAFAWAYPEVKYGEAEHKS